MRKLGVTCSVPALFFMAIPLLIDTVKVFTGKATAGETKTLLMWHVVFLVFKLLKKKTTSVNDVKIGTAVLVVLALSSDWLGQVEAEKSTAYATWTPTWPWMIIFMDAALVTSMPKWFELSLLVTAILWILIRSTEDCYRWGLYDFPTAPERNDTLMLCPEEGGACAKECTFWDFNSVMHRTVLVVALDFYITRDFRDQAKAAVDLAEDVAAAMVRFDLQSAQEQLDGAARAPPRLKLAFELLLENLHRYRPFLPDALFEQDLSDLLPEKKGKKSKKRRARKQRDPNLNFQLSEAAETVSPTVAPMCPPAAAERASQASSRSSASRSVASSRQSSPRGSSMASSASGSIASRSSRQSSHAAAGGARAILQVMQLGLTKKTVVMVGVALRPWDWVVQSSSQEVETAVAGWLETVWSSAKAAKATILGVRGQAATLVWGSMVRIAVTPACIKAAACVDELLKNLATKRFPGQTRPHCGICVGGMQVGNVGSNDFREHALIGPLPSTVRALAHYAEYARVSTLCDKASAQNVENEYDVRHVDRWHFPAVEEHVSQGSSRPVDIFEIQAAKQAAETDEWMYQLEAQEAKNQGQAAHFTSGLEKLFQDANGTAAAEAFSRHLEEDPEDMPVQRLREAAAAHDALHPGLPYARNIWRDPHWDMYRRVPANPPVPPKGMQGPPPGSSPAFDTEVSTVSSLG
eukprot:TRINITY_DN6166_c0_g2_i3.p1 TRINITY_DN6166_c0_g2~~TRINITY_DN6166_c0_g2_i3.p1  ORF type:complete len:694 (+),score=211.80 TRINITY_DN6166_c0_g2_i3:465-2546(+)